MFEDFPNPERYRITGRVPATDESPYFTFESEVYAIFMPEDLEMVKTAAKQFQEFFGLSKWEIQILKTRDKWEPVKFDD